MKESAKLPLRNVTQIIKNLLMWKNKSDTRLSPGYWKLANKKLHPRISWSIKGNYKSYNPIQEDVASVCTKNWK